VRTVDHKCDKIKLLQEGSLGKYSSIHLKALVFLLTCTLQIAQTVGESFVFPAAIDVTPVLSSVAEDMF
jgi:hypothetical protein